MPIIESKYRAPLLFRKGHVSTIYSGLFRKTVPVHQERERIRLSDGDFLDLDWSYSKLASRELIVVLHGLEGDAQRPYMLGTASYFNENNVDSVCINLRGCSGEDNLKYRSYHSGATEDLQDVLQHIIDSRNYESIFLKGFSLGGNLVLKYLGEGREVSNQIKAAVAVSVPCYLQGSCRELHTFKNVLYANRFKKHLILRLTKKLERFPNKVSDHELKSIQTLYDFDNVYTAAAHGFLNADDYYEKSSSLQFLKHISRPTLVINALNDSFLSPECFPVKDAKENNYLFLEMPKHGGHVGFYKSGKYYYNEVRAFEFISEHN